MEEFKKEFQVEEETVEFLSCNKRLHETTVEDISINSYNDRTTNDQFVLLKIGEEEVYARIEAIELDLERIVFRRARFTENPRVDIAKITKNYCVWVSCWQEPELGQWKDIKEKFICYKVRGSWFATRIYR